MTTGDLTAVTAASAITEPSVTPSLGPVSALMVTRDGVVKTPVSKVIMGKRASCSASASTVPPASMRRESASVHRGTREHCE